MNSNNGIDSVEIIKFDFHNLDHIKGLTDLTNTVVDHGLGIYEKQTQSRVLSARAFNSGKYTEYNEYLAIADGQVIGHALMHTSLKDNTHLGHADISVHPQWRRLGLGTKLYNLIEADAIAAKRDTFLGYVPEAIEESPADLDVSGRHFSLAMGYKMTNTEIQRRNDLTKLDNAEIDRLYAAALEKATDYELIQWTRPAPKELLEGLAVLDAGMYTDPPSGETDIRPIEADPDRITTREEADEKKGILRLWAAMQHKETGEVAGMTYLMVMPGSEDLAFQGDTIVHRDHRGHRIGTILKIANQKALLEYRPKMEKIDTWNAESNEHMIAVNESIGYRKLCREWEVQKKVNQD